MYFVKKKWSRARKTTYGGDIYDSGFEANYAQELDFRRIAKDIKSWERQVKIPLDVNGCHICNYYIDFVVHHNNGDVEYLETKGYATDVWKFKWRLFEALYSEKPGVILTVVSQGKNKRPKVKKV